MASLNAKSNLLLLSLLFLSLTTLLTSADKKPVHLHFYMQEKVTDPNATAIVVAKGPIPLPGTPYRFGDIAVVDNALTKGPYLDSGLVGQAQGLFTVMKSDLSVIWTFNIVFTYGENNGSTVAILGRDAITQPSRELTVVGGSGIFHMAQGYLLIKTYSVNIASGDAVLELDLYVYPFKK
ncbi:dirigent protein 21-like protein [Carex littledalei]|uniref:Dirigent protein n=1 Tax=Carex littledalei TaxID=544730 RepID=A0A833VGF1_9POAL|nr:dirigent protein 21-like protein [Carex littledalei]